MQDRGEIVACDIVAERLARVGENAARLGLTCVRPERIAGDADLYGALGEFDAVLIDAPCSNTGVIARRPEARFGLTPARLASLVMLQRDLLRRAAACVRAGGRLVYSTCSIEPQENEEVVQAFLRENRGWRFVDSQTALPRWGAKLTEWRDGGFVARLERA
jgi:16S rRNA (cytosine967-C5)-methyltransferase